MTALLTLSALALTLLGLGYLTAGDPKRRRSFKLRQVERRFLWPARLLVFAPGLALLVLGQGAAFVMWMGAATIAGWLIAAKKPSSASKQRQSMSQ